MIASLPMYDWPEEQSAVDATWAKIHEALRKKGIESPPALTRADELTGVWTHPDLILGQTCGLPYALGLHKRVNLIGTFDHKLDDTPAGFYRSVIVVRAGEPRSVGECMADKVAVNSPTSQSGWGALSQWASGYEHPQWGEFIISGSHRKSAELVAQGHASIAALDIVSFGLLKKHAPDTAEALEVVVQTRSTPALPLICASRFDPDTVSEAVTDALGAGALVRHSPAAYLSVPRIPFPA